MPAALDTSLVSMTTADGWSTSAELLSCVNDGPLPVVLLHGLSQQRRFWHPVMRRLRTRPVISLDQRGHGDSSATPEADFSLDACADDVITLMDLLTLPTAVVVGHSWGAAVALRAAARHPSRVRTAVLVDGGLWTPGQLGPRDEVRARLTPPPLGIPADELWSYYSQGELSPWWTEEARDALEPTYVADAQGRVRTRIGIERHMAVLEGLLDAEPARDISAAGSESTPVWVVACEPRPEPSPVHDSIDARWRRARADALDAVMGLPHVTTLRWTGALHDVPLQWPGLVAALIDEVVNDSAREVGR